MSGIKNLLRKNMQDLQPYSTARDEYDGEVGIFLDANENSLGSATEWLLNRYPDPHQRKLKRKIAELKKVPTENLFLGNGSDEAIDLLIRAFCEPQKDKIIVMPPTYGMYKVCAAINDVDVLKVPLDSKFEIDLNEVFSHLTPETKLIFICSPNNPTGNCFDAKNIKHILEQFHGLVIIDEAYIDFTPEKSWLPRLQQYENLIILHTFSKAWGLASIRLGMAFAKTEIIDVLNKIKYPYNVNGVTQEIALKVLDNLSGKDQMVEEIIKQREILITQLRQLPMFEEIYPSEANFILTKVKGARDIYRYLLSQKIIVRDRSQAFHCESCLRITVGTPEENYQLIESLKKYNRNQ